MQVHGSTALVTGANRGLGAEFVRQLVERGATKVYATSRSGAPVDLPGVEVLQLDITDAASVEAVARVATDVDLLVNNAGISTFTDLVTGDLDKARAELDVHLWGTLAVTRALAPVLAGGAIVNVLSALSSRVFPGATAYCVAKAAEWALTNATRVELASQGTQVLGLHLAATETDMMAGYAGPMNKPADVVRAALDGLEAGALEVLVDDDTRAAKSALSLDPAEAYADLLG